MTETNLVQWETFKLRLRAGGTHSWWEFPVTATFTHNETGTVLELEGCWDGGDAWLIPFAAPLAGTWRYAAASPDSGLDGAEGIINVRAPASDEIAANPSYRGQLRISADGRYFEHADGTPFFLLADTLWAGNTLRCGLGRDKDGPFYGYLADRKAKGFTAVLMAYMRGFGDTTAEPAGQRNEGGYPFEAGDCERLNPAYFQALDRRMDAIWAEGLAAAMPVTWFGKLNCFFSLTWAKRISSYVALRYGTYNSLWCLSGEYYYAMRDCGWQDSDINELGGEVQRHNPYAHPVSIHPSGVTEGRPAPHNVQSSRPFHDSAWLDHNWLQTGQRTDKMCNTPFRARENYDLQPAKPVFLAEGYYEREPDPDHAYHSRWQAWSAYLNGALGGYGYGAFGVWQFFDPDDAHGETGKQTEGVVPWRVALAFEGSCQMRHVGRLITRYPWWRLEPARERLTIDGGRNPLPTPADITPPHCASIPGQLYVVYIPRGNSVREIAGTNLKESTYTAIWYDPRSGNEAAVGDTPRRAGAWTLPGRPNPADEDWVLVLSRIDQGVDPS